MKSGILNLLFLINVFLFSMCSSKIEKTAFVETITLYEEFKMSKDLDVKLNNIINKRQVILDSVYSDLIITKNKALNDKEFYQQFLVKKEQFNRLENEFKNENDKINSAYNERIWNQLNEYIGEYGKEKNYAYIFGVAGTGNLMYAEESKNVTDSVILYVNNKYLNK